VVLTGAELAIAIIAVVAGACLQGSLGFGLGLVAAPVLVILDSRLVPGVILGIGVPLTYLMAWRERRSLDVRGVSWAIVGRMVGTVFGTLAVVMLAERALALFFAFSLLTAVMLSIIGLSITPTPRTLLAAGVGSGFMGTATSVGGPPMALLLQREEGAALRASLAAFMAFGATFSLVALVSAGQFSRIDAVTAVVLAVPALAGFALSRWTNRILDRGYTRTVVLVFATASAVSILIKTLA
jgi:uncharacterized membrane protein YfcA